MKNTTMIFVFGVAFLAGLHIAPVTAQEVPLPPDPPWKHPTVNHPPAPVPGFPIPDFIPDRSSPSLPSMPVFDESLLLILQDLDRWLYQGYMDDLMDIGNRFTGTAGDTAAAEYIYAEFVNLGLDARFHEWSYDGFTSRNVEGVLAGINGDSDEVYLICGHADSVPGTVGADDNASGTAAVLCAASVMSGFEFEHTIRFVTFSGEELGLFGSYFYAEEAAANDDNLVAVLNADMIGYAPDSEAESKLRFFENTRSEWITDYATDISQVYNEYLGLQVVPSGETSGSDHYSFWIHGYNAIFAHEYTFNPAWHLPEDTTDNINFPYATDATRLLVATLASMSEPAFTNPALGRIATALGRGIEPTVRTYDTLGRFTGIQFRPYRPEFLGGVYVAAGRLNGSGSYSIVTGAGRGGGPHVRAYLSNGLPLPLSFRAYKSTFKGGVRVAMGNLDGAGFDEIVTGAGPGGGPHVRAFDRNGRPTGTSFMAFESSFRGGVHVGAGDLNGDGTDEILVSSGLGRSSMIRAFNGSGSPYGLEIAPFSAGYLGGATVAGGDVDGDGMDEIIIGSGPSQEPQVRIYDGQGNLVDFFLAYRDNFRGGVYVSAGDLDGSPGDEIVTGAGGGGGAHVRAFYSDGTPLAVSFIAEPAFTGGVRVAVQPSD